jgi:hypothetical protein
MRDGGAALDEWDDAPIFDVGQEKLATLPDRPPAKPTDTLITFAQATAILGVTRGAIYQWLKSGRLTDRGRNASGHHVLSAEEVEAFARERANAKLEKSLTGPAREQARLERVQGVNVAMPETRARVADPYLGRDLLDELRQSRQAAELAAQQQLSAMREIIRESRETNERLSEQNAMLLGALGAVGIAAILPDRIKEQIKQKRDEVVGGVVDRLRGEPTMQIMGGARQPEPERPALTEAQSTVILAALQDHDAEQKKSVK